MKQESCRELYAYWNRLRGDQPAPQRGEIDPAELRRILGDIFILEAVDADTYMFRLAGTRVCGAYCREMKGSNFLEVWSARDRIVMKRLLTAVTEESAVAVLGVHGINDRGQGLSFEALLLPLRNQRPRPDRLIGVLAPIDPPYWLGVNPILRQEISGLRLINYDESRLDLPLDKGLHKPLPASLPEPAPARSALTRRRPFIVVKGGKQSEGTPQPTR
jgi:hypothetical protein